MNVVNMKKTIIFTYLILTFLFSNCSDILGPKKELSASFRITSWDQDYYEYSKKWAYVYIYFEVENTGDLTIDYYEVYFDVKCQDGSIYHDWTNGSNVKTGKKYSDYTIVDAAGKKATSVKITDWDLEHY